MNTTTPRLYPHASGHAIIARVTADSYGFVSADELARIADDPATRLQPMLVRCGGCRFTAPAQDVKHLIDIITADARDYVRDVSLPAR